MFRIKDCRKADRGRRGAGPVAGTGRAGYVRLARFLGAAAMVGALIFSPKSVPPGIAAQALEPPAYRFRLIDQQNRWVRLADFRGRYVHVDFAAIWCMPCRVQAAYLRGLEDALKPKGFVSMTIMVSRDPRDAARWAGRYNLHTVMLDPTGRVRDRFGAFSFPTNIVIGPDGKLVARWAGAPSSAAAFRRQLERLVPQMFAETVPPAAGGLPRNGHSGRNASAPFGLHYDSGKPSRFRALGQRYLLDRPTFATSLAFGRTL